MHKLFVIFFIIFFTSINIFAEDFSDICHKEGYIGQFENVDINEFNKTLKDTIVIDLRISNRELVELKKCFSSYSYDCVGKISRFKKLSKNYYQKMRLALAMSAPERGGDSFNELYYRIDTESLNGFYLDKIITINIAHTFSNLTKDLPPLSNAEMKDVFDEYNLAHEEFEKKEFGKTLSELDYAEFSDEQRFEYNYKTSKFVRSFRKSKEAQYLNLLARMPLIGLMTSESPSDNEYQELLNKLISNSNEIIGNLSEIDLISFTSSVKRILKVDRKYCGIAMKMLDDYHDKLFKNDLAMVGTMIIGYSGCVISRLSALFKGLCKSLFGLGFNGLFIYKDNLKLEESYNIAFATLYANNRLRDLRELSDDEFSAFLSWLTLPVGTGVPDLLNSFKRTL